MSAKTHIVSCYFFHQLVNLNGDKQLSVVVSLFSVLSLEISNKYWSMADE